MTKALTVRNSLKKPDPDDLFRAVAMDIGKEVAAYIEVMYPEAVKAASSTFLLALRNTVVNEIMAFKNPSPLDGESVVDRLDRRAKWRREWKAMYKNIRKESADEDAEGERMG